MAISTPVFVVGFGLLLLFGDEIGAFNLGLGIPIRYTPFAEDPLGLSVTGAAFVVVTTAALQAVIDGLDPRARR